MNGPRFNEMLALVSRGLMVRTDSRQVQPGEVFALMPSAADKAAVYLADALSRGAGWVVAGHGISMPGDMKAGLVRVDDTAHTLGNLAGAHFRTREQASRWCRHRHQRHDHVSHLLEGLLAACGR